VTLLCAPGSATTECATPTARRTCASDGMSYTATACATGQSCTAGVCAVRCGDGIVGSGETCDDGNTVSGDGCSSVCASEACGAMSMPVRGGYGQVADAIPLRLSATSFTVEVWAYATDFGAFCNNALIIKRGSGTADGWFFSVQGSGCGGTSGRLYWQQSGGTGPSITATASTPVGRWFHAAYTYDRTASRGKLWLDGVEVGSGSIAVPSATTTSPLRIGQDTDGAPYGWLGRIDDVRISNVIRYSAAFTPNPSLAADANTMALWRFEEGSGTTAADSSGSGYTATLTSGATWASVPGCSR
jgi:cysteine-rich repeat protein